MTLVLNTNYSSLVAQNSLTASGSKLSSALQQLSSGMRINTAADDAAGYAITQGMTSQIDGINQAVRNANDGVSLAQTASGALQEVTNDLQTMRDLAVQSLNASNSAQDRADLDAQFQQLKADINSVSSQTQFNGVNLLDGTFQGATFQVGANAGQTISVASVSSTSSGNLGKLYTDAGTSAFGVTNTATGKGDTVTLKVGSFTTSGVTLTGTAAVDLKNIAAAINQGAQTDGGLIATVNAAGTGIDLSSTTNPSAATAVAIASDVDSTGATSTAATVANLGLNASYDLTSASATATSSFVDKASVTSVDNSNKVLVQIDAALQQLATTGAQLGAYQNRFQAAITGLTTNSTNLSSARSQIQDTDYAQATSALSKAQILQQASTAMVAQANTIPQNILTLLQKLP
ncbi:MAG: flagellin [Sinobacteraceae bacterium]|nr:flagellin [Nevskiaceae bacterium]